MDLICALRRKKSFILILFFVYIICWLTISAWKQLSDIHTSSQSNRLRHRSSSTFYQIFNHLFQLKINLILIDPYALNYLFIRQLPLETLQKPLITFAITDESVQRFFQSIPDMKFSIKLSRTILSSREKSVDHIFIEYNYRIVHLAVLHKYNSYYLIHKNTHPLSDNIQLPYGDKLRAIEYIESELHEYLFSYPRNVSHFLWFYNTSEFIHCDQTLANRMKTNFHLPQNTTQLNMFINPMRDIASGLNQLEKHYWFAGGTLLGWYRHCGLIPYTKDADLGLYAEEYDESIRTYFLGNPTIFIWAALGLVNDSLEFRLSSGRFVYDLFWAYRNGNRRWVGYQVQRLKYKRILPLLPKLCSGDLFGYRFSVPCSPVNYLNREYGKNRWKTPLEKNYTWTNMRYNSMWNDISWMYAVRLYTRKGKLRSDKVAIDWISKRFNYSLTSIPSFLNVIPNETVTLPPLKTELVYGPTIKKKRRAVTKRNVGNTFYVPTF